MSPSRNRIPSGWRRLLFWLRMGSAVLATAALVLLFYGLSLSADVRKRFEGRRWNAASGVFSDILVVYPGQRLTRNQLVQRLGRLGYRRIARPPLGEGEYQSRATAVTVHLRSVRLPVLERKARTVRVSFAANKVQALRDARTKASLPLMELEPEELMRVFGDQHESRQVVSMAEVPPVLVDAVLAAEDADFFGHAGFDLQAIARALYVNVRAGAVRQGASTITQQLAKNFFLTPERTISRKLKELMIALVMEVMYSKETILELYLNEIYLGQKGSVSIHGVKEAARFYFGKGIDELRPSESATLAGLIRAPNLYSPHNRPKAARKRRNQVLRAMRTMGRIDEATYRAALRTRIETVDYIPYTRTAPYFFDYVTAQLRALYPEADLTRLGLSLYTTLDVGVQAAAEQALKSGLQRLEKLRPKLKKRRAGRKLEGAVVVLEPRTGHILAMVGGRNYGESQFNRMTQARRQPGSAFKPFVYLAALERFNLTESLDNEPKIFRVGDERWEPKNYTDEYGGRVSMREGLARSLNLPTVDLARKIRLDPIIKTARAFGMTTPLKPRPSLALGAFEVVPLELALAYAALASDGVLPHALSVRSVADEKGEVIHRRHLKIRSVTTPPRAFLMSSLLRSVVTGGTASSLSRYGIRYPVAGKTGTTNDYRDAWFVGYTPEIVALVWVGFDNGESVGLPAASAALPIWASLMRQIRWRMSETWFEAPAEIVTAVACTDSGALAVEACPNQLEEFFEADRAPTEVCPLHGSSVFKGPDDPWSTLAKPWASGNPEEKTEWPSSRPREPSRPEPWSPH